MIYCKHFETFVSDLNVSMLHDAVFLKLHDRNIYFVNNIIVKLKKYVNYYVGICNNNDLKLYDYCSYIEHICYVSNYIVILLTDEQYMLYKLSNL